MLKRVVSLWNVWWGKILLIALGLVVYVATAIPLGLVVYAVKSNLGYDLFDRGGYHSLMRCFELSTRVPAEGMGKALEAARE